MLTQDKITKIFCIIDNFFKEYFKEIKKYKMLPSADGKKHQNRTCEMLDSEIMTILLLFHFGTFKNFKHYYLHYICIHLKKEFPKTLSYNRFIAIEHHIFVPMSLFFNMLRLGKCTGITFIDSTKIAVCHNKRIRRNKILRALQVSERIQWAGFIALNCTLSATIKENYCHFVLRLPTWTITAYCFFDKKPAIHFEIEKTAQLVIFQ
jgi:hypothetical protein